jgi:hypothetical protein
VSAHPLAALPAELCHVFLGWRLREDYDALLALGEGALRIDLRTGETWCDGDPLPPLFIAGELRGRLERALEAAGLPAAALREARLDAVFAARRAWRGGREVPLLELACRATLSTDGADLSAEANNAPRATGPA